MVNEPLKSFSIANKEEYEYRLVDTFGDILLYTNMWQGLIVGYMVLHDNNMYDFDNLHEATNKIKELDTNNDHNEDLPKQVSRQPLKQKDCTVSTYGLLKEDE